MRLIFIFLLLLFPRFLHADDEQKITIGAILSLSGGLEQWCDPIRQGMEFAAQEKSSVKIVIRYGDDQSVDRQQTISAAHHLLDFKDVDLLFTWTTSSVPYLKPIVSKAQVPLVVAAYDQTINLDNPLIFSAFVNYQRLAEEVVDFFVKKMSLKRIAMVVAEDPWSQSFEAPFRSRLAELGAELFRVETVAPQERDLSAILLRFKRDKVDGIFAPLYGAALISLVSQAHQQKFTGAIQLADGIFAADLKVLGAKAEGVYATQILLPKSSQGFPFTGSESIFEKSLAAIGYDFVTHLRKAAEQIVLRKDTITPQSLQQELRTFKSRGQLGEQMYGAPPAGSGEQIVRISGGKFVLLDDSAK